jgi:hypothetical protein
MNKSKTNTPLTTMTTIRIDTTRRICNNLVSFITRPRSAFRAWVFGRAIRDVMKTQCPNSKFKVHWTLQHGSIRYILDSDDIKAQTCFAWIEKSLTEADPEFVEE